MFFFLLDYLSIIDLKDVVREVWDAHEKWRNIAIQLDLPPSLVNHIGHDVFVKGVVGLTKVLELWLRGSFLRWRAKERPSWETLIAVLNQRTVGHQELASRLEEKYLKALPPPTASDLSVEATTSATCFPRVCELGHACM